MKKNDFVLPILIILLMFFLPCTIYGLKKNRELSEEDRNPNHLPRVDNTLYFYDKADKLIGTYECKYGICGSASTSIDDKYNVHYEGEDARPGIFSGKNVFIQDGDLISLYNLETKQTISKYLLIKNYGIGISGDQIIVQNEDGLYGLFDMANFRLVIPTTYTYLGLRGDIGEDGLIDPSILIAQKDYGYYLISIEEEVLSPKANNPIYDYSADIIYTRSTNGNYFILNYDGDLVVNDIIKSIGVFDGITVFINSTGEVKIYNSDFSKLLKEEKYPTNNVSFSFEDKKLTITNNDDNTFIEYNVEENLSSQDTDNPNQNKENEDDFWNTN